MSNNKEVVLKLDFEDGSFVEYRMLTTLTDPTEIEQTVRDGIQTWPGRGKLLTAKVIGM